MIATVRPPSLDPMASYEGTHAIAVSRVETMPTSSRPNALDLSNSRRIPRLTVRSRSDETAISDMSQSSEDSNTESQRLYIRSGAYSPINGAPAYDDRSRHGSSGSQGYERPHRSHASKKKSAGVLGFLTLKEPSTSALEEFAEMEKRKVAAKGSKSIAMVMPGVSSQRLPDHVPKVNSKWDGLPETGRRKEKAPSSPLDLRSFPLGRSASKREPYGSLSSRPSIRQSQDKRRSVMDVMEYGQGQTSAYSPKLPGIERSNIRHSTYTTPSPPPDLDLPDLSGYTITSPEASPRTPGLDTISPMPILGGTYGTSNWTNENDDVTVKSAGQDVLGLPRMRVQPMQPGAMANYYPASGSNTTPGLQSPRSLNVPFEYRNSMISSDAAAPPQSSGSASSSSVSSNMSAQWRSPPKERLSMGPQIRRTVDQNQVLPWEMFDGPPEETTRQRQSSATAESSNKLKRLGYRLGRR